MKYLLVALSLVSQPLISQAGSADEALDEALKSAKWKSALHLGLQRPVDPRVTKIESGEFGGGDVHLARSPAEVRALSGKLRPGDQLLLAGAAWKDARFTFEGRGTAEAPVVIRPEKLIWPLWA